MEDPTVDEPVDVHMLSLRRPSHGLSRSAKYAGAEATRAPAPGTPAADAAVGGITSPPSTALFFSGLSHYPHEQYQQHHRPSLGKTQMFDVTREAHDRHGNPVCFPREGPRQRARMTEAREAYLATEKARAATEGAAAKLETEYQAATAYVKPPRGRFTPKWVKLDRQVLRYYGWFKEPVVYSRIESFRVRRVELLYYLVDDTVNILEQHIDNSGMKQGEFLKRQKVYHDGTSRAVTPLDLNVGAELTLFGRCYHIVDADAHTRGLLASKFDITLGSAEEYAETPYVPTTTTFAHHPKPTTIAVDVGFEEDLSLGFYHRKPDTLHKFLENDRKVLSFDCVWDDTSRLYGERRRFRLNFYLSDDTVEVSEVGESTRGRGPFTRLLSRQRVPLPHTDKIRTYPWGKESKVPRRPCNSSVRGPHTPPRDFSDAVNPDCRDKVCLLRRPATAGERPSTARSRPVTPRAGRPLTARSSRSLPRPATADAAMYNRRDVNPITGLPTYTRPPSHGGRGSDEPCCGSDAACAIATHPTKSGRTNPSVGAASSGAGLGSGALSDLPARYEIVPDYLTAGSFKVGRSVQVFDRLLEIKSCDEFTRQWYRNNLNIEQEDAPRTPPRTPGLHLKLPPGKKVELRPPTPPTAEASPHVFVNDSRVIRCIARLVTEDEHQATRRFVLTYYVVDHSLGIFEPVVPNTGHPGGKFLERGLHRNADAGADTTTDPRLELPLPFRATDFQPGAILRFHHCPDQSFELVDVDSSSSGLDSEALASGEEVPRGESRAGVQELLARMAWRLDGRVSSVMKTLEGYDWRVRGGVDSDVAFALFRAVGITERAMADENLRRVVDKFEDPSTGLTDYRRLLSALRNTPVATVSRRDLFKDADSASPRTPPRPTRQAWGDGQDEGKGHDGEEVPVTGIVAARAPPRVSEEELVQRRLRLLLGNLSPKLLMHFFRLQDPAHGGFIGARCFLHALGEAGLSLGRADKSFVMSVLFPTRHACVEYAKLLESLFGPACIAKST